MVPFVDAGLVSVVVVFVVEVVVLVLLAVG